MDKRAQDLRKILILAGLKVETELSDPETVALIAKVIENFDPNKAIDEDAALFSSRFVSFERRAKKDGAENARVRQKATKRVSEAYQIDRA